MERHSCSWIKRFTIVKMAIFPTLIYRLKAISIQILTLIFAEIHKLSWNLHKNARDPDKLKESLKNVLGLTLTDFKTYYRWYLHWDRYINQGNRIESPGIKHHIYGQLIFLIRAPR